MASIDQIFSNLGKVKEPYKITITLKDLQILQDRSPSALLALKNSGKLVSTEKDDEIILEIPKYSGRSVDEQYTLELGVSQETQMLMFRFGVLYKQHNIDDTFINEAGNEVKGVPDSFLYDVLSNPSQYKDKLTPELTMLANEIKDELQAASKDMSLEYVTSFMNSRVCEWEEKYTTALSVPVFTQLLNAFNSEFKPEKQKKTITQQLTSTIDK